jgi:hypothetical protein
MKIGGAPHLCQDTRVCGVETLLDAFVGSTNPHFSILSQLFRSSYATPCVFNGPSLERHQSTGNNPVFHPPPSAFTSNTLESIRRRIRSSETDTTNVPFLRYRLLVATQIVYKAGGFHDTGTLDSKLVVNHFFECQPNVWRRPRGQTNDLWQRSDSADSLGFNFSALNVWEVELLKYQFVKITNGSDLTAFIIRQGNVEDLFGPHDQFHCV